VKGIWKDLADWYTPFDWKQWIFPASIFVVWMAALGFELAALA
jgi:hypothetical protein